MTSPHFFVSLSKIASGEKGKPSKNFEPDLSVLKENSDKLTFADTHFKLRGTFDEHYWASIPYIFEQECRLGAGLIEYAHQFRSKKHPLLLWHIGAAEGTLIRSLSQLGDGVIVSMADTGSEANRTSFLMHGTPRFAHLFVGHHTDITKTTLQKFDPRFCNGFDVIIEDTCFQMLGNNRVQQINHVADFLSPDGILILTEKCNTSDYTHWEYVKDANHKRRFFNETHIQEKRDDIVDEMRTNQVSIDQLIQIASRRFKLVRVFWNSCNFYSVACSNSIDHIKAFLESIGESVTPCEFKRQDEISTSL